MGLFEPSLSPKLGDTDFFVAICKHLSR